MRTAYDRTRYMYMYCAMAHGWSGRMAERERAAREAQVFLFDIKRKALGLTKSQRRTTAAKRPLTPITISFVRGARPETMVFVAAAAVSAGAYGAYKGGQAAVKGTKQKLNDIKLERNGKAEYNAKSKERASRLSAIEKKHSASATATASTSIAGAAGRSSSASASAPGAGGSAGGKSVEERLAERRSAKAAAAANSGTAGSKKKGSVLSRFKK